MREWNYYIYLLNHKAFFILDIPIMIDLLLFYFFLFLKLEFQGYFFVIHLFTGDIF